MTDYCMTYMGQPIGKPSWAKSSTKVRQNGFASKSEQARSAKRSKRRRQHLPETMECEAKQLTSSRAAFILGSFNPGAEFCHAIEHTSSRGQQRHMRPRVKRGMVPVICERFGITKSTLWRLLAGVTKVARDAKGVLANCLAKAYEVRPEIPQVPDGRKQWRTNKQNAVSAYSKRPLTPEEEQDWRQGVLPDRVKQLLLAMSKQQAELWCERNGFDFEQLGWEGNSVDQTMPLTEAEANEWADGTIPQRIVAVLKQRGKEAITAWLAKCQYGFSNAALAVLG